MRAANRLAFSLMVEVSATFATRTLVCGSPEADMSCHFPHCPCEYFEAYGGQLRLAFSLMVEVSATFATRTLVCGSPEADMSCHFPHCPCEYFEAYGGQLLIGRCHLFFYFRSCFHSSMP